MLGLCRCVGFCSSCGVWTSHYGGFFCCGPWDPEHRLNSCGPCASLLRGMWDLPGSGIKPTCLALTAGFFTTEPPGKRLAVKSFHLTIFQIINRSKPTVEIRVQIKNFCSWHCREKVNDWKILVSQQHRDETKDSFLRETEESEGSVTGRGWKEFKP